MKKFWWGSASAVTPRKAYLGKFAGAVCACVSVASLAQASEISRPLFCSAMSASHVCDLCGYPAPRASVLANHRGARRCTLNRMNGTYRPARAVVSDTGRGSVLRRGNVRRALRTRLPVIIRYLKHNISRQREALRRGCREVYFIPFGDGGVQPADLRKMLRWLRARDATPERRAAGCLLVPFGWTPAFAKIVGLPPVPWTEAYANQLRADFMRCHREQRVVYNPEVRSCRARSFLNALSARDALRSVQKQVALMKAAVAATPRFLQLLQEQGCDAASQKRVCKGLPGSGYTLRSALVLWRQMTATTWSECALPVVPYSKKVGETLAELTASDVKEINRNVCYGSVLIDTLAREIRSNWTGFGPRMALPGFDNLNLVGQLCAWRADGRGERVGDFPTILAGALLT